MQGRMLGYIREFNRLEPHSSHDLVFKIRRNNKTEATFRVFCLWLWVARNQFSMGTTGILIYKKNIKFKILPLINASLSDFTGFFTLKANQKLAIFAWIFACVDFHGKIKTKVCRNCEGYHLKWWHLFSGDPKTLTPGPWIPLRTWTTDQCMDRPTDPPPPPPTEPPLRTPHKKKTIKMTIRDLTYRLFCFAFCCCCLLHCSDERRTCVLQKRPIT